MTSRIAFAILRSVKNSVSNSWPSEPARKVNFLRTVSFAGSIIRNYLLTLKGFGLGIKLHLNLKESVGDC